MNYNSQITSIISRIYSGILKLWHVKIAAIPPPEPIPIRVSVFNEYDVGKMNVRNRYHTG